MSNLSELINKTLNGNMAAYETIIKMFQGMASAYSFSILKDNELANDASQEAFIEAYYHLNQLQNPEAFPGWFKQIVFKQCDRITRSRKETVFPAEYFTDLIICPEKLPDAELESLEIRELVRLSADTLSSEQRTVLLLFYIRDYSLNDIASFLEIAVSTVKKRLFDARKNLKERITKMVKNQIADLEPKEIFSQKIIHELMNRPDLLKIPHNPVSQVLEIIKKALPDFEFVDSAESVPQSTVTMLGDDPNYYFHLENNDLLRCSTTLSLIAMLKDQAVPCKLLLGGRVYRPGLGRPETDKSVNAFYQAEISVIGENIKFEDLDVMMVQISKTILKSTELAYDKFAFRGFMDCRKYFAKGSDSEEVSICAGGMFKPELLDKLGIDSKKYRGYSVGIGLDRMAMAKFGLNSIQELYKPQYL